jgi:hypothetical protein
MIKSDYELLFQEAVHRALQEADLFPVSSEPLVEFHGRPNPQGRITLAQALDLLWLSSDRHYRVIDVAAFSGEDKPPIIFVRPAGFEPGPFSDTWDPADLGPFKVMGPATRGRRV